MHWTWRLMETLPACYFPSVVDGACGEQKQQHLHFKTTLGQGRVCFPFLQSNVLFSSSMISCLDPSLLKKAIQLLHLDFHCWSNVTENCPSLLAFVPWIIMYLLIGNFLYCVLYVNLAVIWQWLGTSECVEVNENEFLKRYRTPCFKTQACLWPLND